jgi:hypothetical protein
MEFGLWIVAYIGDIDLPGHPVLDQETGDDLFRQHDKLLSLESLPFSGKHDGIPFVHCLKITII